MDGIQSENVREIETVDLLTDSAAELDPNAAVDAAVTDEKAATASQSDAVNKAVNSSEAAADGKDVAAVRNNELPSNTNEQSLEAVPSENGTKVGTSAHPTQPATEEELDVMCRQGGSECSSCQSQNVLVSFKSSNKASCRFDPATAICALSTDGASSFECGAVKGLIKALDDGTTSSFVFNGLIAVAFLAGAFFFRRRILKLYGGGGKYSSLTSGEQREEDADELFSGAMSGTRAGLSNGSGMHGVAQLRNSSLKNASEM